MCLSISMYIVILFQISFVALYFSFLPLYTNYTETVPLPNQGRGPLACDVHAHTHPL